MDIQHAYDFSDGTVWYGDGRSHNTENAKALDNIITTVVGNGIADYSGDGGTATQASLRYPAGVAVDGDGGLYIADRDGCRIRRVGTNGIITTVVGKGDYGYNGDGGLATRAKLATPECIAVGADGGLYIADTSNSRIRKVALPLTITVRGLSEIAIPSEDGSEVYIFNTSGRHLRTLNAFTNATSMSFSITATDTLQPLRMVTAT